MLVFVAMPFDGEFDDVFASIEASAAAAAVKYPSVGLRIQRADQLRKTGSVTEHIRDLIFSCDLVVADVTGSNANVFYEIGFAHALQRPVVLLRQKGEKIAFNLQSDRIIDYERKFLSRTLRHVLTEWLEEAARATQSTDAAQSLSSSPQPNLAAETLVEVEKFFADSSTVSALQTIYLDLQFANASASKNDLQAAGTQVMVIAQNLQVENADESDARNTAAVLGNCAVQLEKGREYDLAEAIYSRAIALFPRYPGLRLQFSDYLMDRRRLAEAERELGIGQQLAPQDARFGSLSARLMLLRATTGQKSSYGGLDQVLTELRANFEVDKSNKRNASGYLLALSQVPERLPEFRAACFEWRDALPAQDKWMATRALADGLAEAAPEEALELYWECLQSPQMVGELRHDTLHNMATLSALLDRAADAQKLWTEAYKIKKSDEVKAVFSQRLATWNQLDLARKVSRGQPID